jgi:hypothetical protein
MCRDHAGTISKILPPFFKKRPDIPHSADNQFLCGMPQCAAIMPRWQIPRKN